MSQDICFGDHPSEFYGLEHGQTISIHQFRENESEDEDEFWAFWELNEEYIQR